jgi:hypothetical protein
MKDKETVFPEGSWGGYMGKVLTRKKAVISEGLFDLPKGHIPLLRILAVPIMHQEVAIGSIMVANKPTQYNQKDSRQLEAIADFTAPVIAARYLVPSPKFSGDGVAAFRRNKL